MNNFSPFCPPPRYLNPQVGNFETYQALLYWFAIDYFTTKYSEITTFKSLWHCCERHYKYSSKNNLTPFFHYQVLDRKGERKPMSCRLTIKPCIEK